MEVYVKEQLHVLDYKDNIVDTIFISDDKVTEGYAYDVQVKESNTGYSDLTFSMPNSIITGTGDMIKNPKMVLLTPLVKLRYHREVYYVGKKEIKVREPQGYGDTTTYIDKVYSNKYPNNVIEDYIMDYIVQPVDKKRNSLEISTQFTAIDYPRFNLSKKRVGLTIDSNTLTKSEWSLFENEPMNIPGKVTYIKWDKDKYGRYSTVETWNPVTAREYPLTKEKIYDMIENSGMWPYGQLSTVFYWPIKCTDADGNSVPTGRYDGKRYNDGDYLTLMVYDFYMQTDAGIDAEHQVGNYGFEWSSLDKVKSYLCPNNADNYLKHILEGTQWKIKQRLNETTGLLEDDVDIEKVEVPNPSGSTTSTTLTDNTCNLSSSNSNCYNAIISVCKALQLYPIFDCVNREVSLKAFAGKNYGLTYRFESNLTSNNVKMDGEKVITKMYVTGGQDNQGSSNINISTAERAYIKKFTGFFTSVAELPTTDVEGWWAVVDGTLGGNYWQAGPNRSVYGYKNGTWNIGTKESNGNWTVDTAGGKYTIDPQTGMVAPWDPNDEEYIFNRSPYGTNYILNLKWHYDNGWITKEEILDLYDIQKQIHDLNVSFVDRYTKDLVNTKLEYNEALTNYDVNHDEYQAAWLNMENKYLYSTTEASKGSFYAFPNVPKGAVKKGKYYYITMSHCYECKTRLGENRVDENFTTNKYTYTCPVCGAQCVNEDIRIPIHADFEDWTDSEAGTSADIDSFSNGKGPRIKGHYYDVIHTLDSYNQDLTYSDYEKMVSIVDPFELRDAEDNKQYIMTYNGNDIYVRASSGAVIAWNEDIAQYIKYYGAYLDDLRRMELAQEKIDELQDEYDAWEAEFNRLQALCQERYGDYLVEGNYANDEQPYDGLLFREGTEASDKFCIPEVTYSLDVIDSSGLIEYRMPMVTKYECSNCGYITSRQINNCPCCSSDNILTINDTYNDLVHMLHSVGQIVPKAGDYVTIYDEPMGMFGVPGLITDITRELDSPERNKITVNTSYTDDEELVGNIITATNTVLNNADIYARTAILNADGTIDAQSLQQSIDDNNANITITGTKGSILLDGSGLRCTDPADANRAMKYTGNGIYSTVNLMDDTEAVIWEKMMTPAGINANYIRAGSIDAGSVNITSGPNTQVVLDGNGLVLKQNASRNYNLNKVQSLVSGVEDIVDLSKEANIDAFIGTNNNGDGIVYVGGYLYASKGSNIANWITDENSFYHKTGNTKDLWLSPTGVTGTVFEGTKFAATEKFAYYANGNFGVTVDGKLYAKDGTFTGNGEFTGFIHVTDDTSDMNMGTMGGWTVGEGGLEKNGVYISSAGINGSIDVGNGYSSNGPWSIYSHGNFGVTTNGTLYAKNAYIGGTVYATAGKIGNCDINNGELWVTNAHIDTVEVKKITGGNNSATITFDGSITCKNLTAYGKITAGSAINGSSFKGGSLDVTNNYGGLKVNVGGEQLKLAGTIGLYKYDFSTKYGDLIIDEMYNGWMDDYVQIGFEGKSGSEIGIGKNGTIGILGYNGGPVIIESDKEGVYISGESFSMNTKKGVTGYVEFSWEPVVGSKSYIYLAFECGVCTYAGKSESSAQAACGNGKKLAEY